MRKSILIYNIVKRISAREIYMRTSLCAVFLVHMARTRISVLARIRSRQWILPWRYHVAERASWDIAVVAAGCSAAAAKKTRHVCRQQINENKVARVATRQSSGREIGFNLYNSVFGLNLGDRFTPTDKERGGDDGGEGSRGKAGGKRKIEKEGERGGNRRMKEDTPLFTQSICRAQLFFHRGNTKNSGGCGRSEEKRIESIDTQWRLITVDNAHRDGVRSRSRTRRQRI